MTKIITLTAAMSLSTSVEGAIDLIAHRLQGVRGPETLDQLHLGAFQGQLPAADSCLDCFLRLELSPIANAPVGGDGKVALGAALGPEGETAEALRRAVATTMTGSYLTMLGLEDPVGSDFVEGRDSEQLWRFWIDHMRSTATLAFGVPGKFAGSVRREGGAQLESEIKRIGLAPGLLRRRAASERCGLIAVFGLLLRLGQTKGCDDATFERSQATEKAQTWPFCADI
ncbi:MAG: hypothetical protein AABM66_10360 [Actinomycetota bacterium]